MNHSLKTYLDKIALIGNSTTNQNRTATSQRKMQAEQSKMAPAMPQPAPVQNKPENPANTSVIPKVAEAKDNADMLTKLATHYRAMQLLAHNSHNLVSGRTFFEDHEFFGDAYGTYESSYDRVVELLIGNGDSPDLVKLQSNAVGKLSSMTKENHFDAILSAEKDLQSLIEDFAGSDPSQAALNMVGDLAEASKVRIYKIRQRIAG